MLGISEKRWKALTEKRRLENFLFACRTPGAWLRRAQVHKRGADILYEIGFAAYERNLARLLSEPIIEGSHSRTLQGQELEDHLDEELLQEYMLLVGYSLECVLKGYLLALIPELVIDEKSIDRIVASHDLPSLFHECAISVTDQEKELLRLITRHIVWGKYTAPLNVKDMPSWIDPADQNEKSLSISNPFHQRRIQVLVDEMFYHAASLLQDQRRA